MSKIKILEAPTGSGKTGIAAATPFVVDSVNPLDFGLPHDEWRPEQLEALLWITGRNPHSVVSLVKTKSLQRENYDRLYAFDAHYGRANFECQHPSADRGVTCAECRYLNDGGMRACPYANRCTYLASKNAAMNSQKASLNYAYWMTALNWRTKRPPEMLFCDEAHNISDIVLEWVGITITAKQQKDWELPEFAELDSTIGTGILIHRGPSPMDVAILWLERAFAIMAMHCEKLELSSNGNAKQRDAYTRADLLCRKIDNALVSIEQCNDDWFILSGKQARTYRGKPEPGFICRPLTARHHAPIYVVGDFKTVMMSATIGNPKTFAGELGLKGWGFRAVPNQWESQRRPVNVLDAPKLGHRSKESEYQKQADVIVRAIKSVDPSWCGFIHVTRKREAALLAERLAERGLQDRVWVPPGANGRYVATDKQMAAWESRKRKVSGSLCISWSMWEGVDGLDEKICVVAKVPFSALGDPYEKARMQYSGRMYLQRAAWQLEQGLGRTRRGREQDYDTTDEQRGLVAIADGNWKRVQKYLSESMKESLIE